MCYSNSVGFVGLLRIYCIHCEVCAKLLCSEKELSNLKDSKLTQNFKIDFVRLGHEWCILQHVHMHCLVIVIIVLGRER